MPETTDEPLDENVSEFRAPVGERRIPRRRMHTKMPCRHYRPEVDEDARIVICADCNAELDPIRVLLDIAHHWGDYAVAEMGREMQSFKRAAWYVKQIEERERRLPDERDMAHDELLRRHNERGCPPDRLVITKRMLECYCGVSVSRTHHRELERAALRAQGAPLLRLTTSFDEMKAAMEESNHG